MLRYLQIQRCRSLADPARGIVVGTVARAVVPAIVPWISNGHATQMRAHAYQHQPFGFGGSLRVVLGVAQGGHVHWCFNVDLLLASVSDEEGFASPFQGQVLALWKKTKMIIGHENLTSSWSSGMSLMSEILAKTLFKFFCFMLHWKILQTYVTTNYNKISNFNEVQLFLSINVSLVLESLRVRRNTRCDLSYVQMGLKSLEHWSSEYVAMKIGFQCLRLC